MDPLLRPETVVAALRRQFRARMLGARAAGAGALALGAVGVPFLMACSCPTWTSRLVRPLTEASMSQTSALSEEGRCHAMCGGTVDSCTYAYMPSLEPDAEPQSMGPVEPNVVLCEVERTMACGMGRPPEGLVRQGSSRQGSSRQGSVAGGRDALAAYLAEAAHLEAASVLSFVQFATELEAHGAPEALVQAAEQAAVDEVRHARATASLAHSFGAEARGPVVWVPAPRSLAEVLRENAAVGGVEETFGAWVLAQQAEDATEQRVRDLTRPVAADEARHAELARVVDAWGRPHLSPPERRGIEQAVEEATSKLATQMQGEPPTELAKRAGLPNATRTQQWFATRGGRA